MAADRPPWLSSPASAASEPLLVCDPPTLHFDHVYDNEMPSLHRMTLRNPCASTVQVDVPPSIDGVRLAQLRASVQSSGTTIPTAYATNTVAWAQHGGLQPTELRALRHWAANLDTCTHLTLAPGATADVFVEVCVRRLDRATGPTEAASSCVSDPQEPHATMLSLALHVHNDTTSHTLHLPMAVHACEPHLEFDWGSEAQPVQTDRDGVWVADVGDVMVGQTVTRQVYVKNNSAIETFLMVRSLDECDDSPVCVLDTRQGDDVVSQFVPLAPRERRAFSLLVEPRASHANFEQTLVLSNAHLVTNAMRLLVRANLLGAATDDALMVLNEGPLDFGDCCGGQWTRQLLILKNPGDAALDVMFRTDAGIEATFQLAEQALPRDASDADMDESEVPDDDVPLGGTSSSTATRPLTDSATESDEEDSDLSSNASQAGSRVGSPSPLDESPASEAATSPSQALSSSTHSLSRSGWAAPSSVVGVAPLSTSPTSSSPAGAGHRLASYSVSALAKAQPPRARRLYDPMAMLRGGGESQHNQMEELVMRPGAQYRVVVSYRPPREPLDAEYSAGKLKTTTFRVYLDYTCARDNSRAHGGRQRREIVCRTRTCTPFISLAPRIVDFGMASVGARKSAQVAVTNHSELSTRIMLRFTSKVLSMYMDEITVPARQTVELKMEFFPRRVNESYRKQITVMNMLNRENDQILEVRARNVDMQRVSFHSLFYRILTPSGSNFLDFGDVNIHASCVRSFGIENLCTTPLALELSVAHPEDLQLYVKAPQLRQGVTERERSAALKEQFLESMATDPPVPAAHTAAAEQVRRTTEARQKHHALALKRGSRGRATRKYGHSVTFRDRSLLRALLYLDLATGPLRPEHKQTKQTLARKHHALHRDAPSPSPSRHDDELLGGRSSSQSHHSSHASPVKPAPRSRPPHSPTTATSVGAATAAAPTLPAQAPSASPALTGLWKGPHRLADPHDVAALDLDGLVAALESQPSSLSSLVVRHVEAEERLVRTEINLQRALREAIATGQLVPLGLLHVPPQSVMQVVAVYTPHGSTRPHIQGTARKQDSRVFLRLLEFDARRASGDPAFEALRARDIDELPVRDLMVRSTVCRSMMELGQPHINFGHMDKGDKRERKIWIQNRSEWALRYCIRKSGSIASGDIKLGRGRYGIVPGYGKRGVDFTFSPSLSGTFYERLLVENIADHDNDQSVVLKASVRKVANFAMDPSTLDFGTCTPSHISMPESVLLSNTTSKQRTFVVKANVDADSAPAPLDVLVAASTDAATRRALSTEEEEEVETLYQKLKIASRKGNVDKLAKYRERLTQLGVPLPAPTTTTSTSASAAAMPTTAEDATATDAARPAAAEEPGQAFSLVHSGQRGTPSVRLTLQIAAHSSLKLLVRVRAYAGTHAATAVQVPLYVHEAKNSDEMRTVHVHARIES